MPLLPCLECGHATSSAAAACPKCGHPTTPPKKKSGAVGNIAAGCGWTLLVPVIFIAVANLTQSDEDRWRAKSMAETSTKIREAEQTIRAAMRDPESAIFADQRRGADGAICGTVNGRNAYGGMTGPMPFWVNRGSVYVLTERDVTNAETMRGYAVLCPPAR